MVKKVNKRARFPCINKKNVWACACMRARAHAHTHTHTHAHIKLNDSVLFVLPEILDRVSSQSKRSLGLYLLGVHPTWDVLATTDVDCHEIHT